MDNEKLTLSQWAKQSGESIHTHDNGSTYVHAPENDYAYRELFNLVDYRVSSVVAGVIWLVKQ